MDEKELRAQVVATGIELLRDALVARTWGNISARVSEDKFLITPSGLLLDFHTSNHSLI